MRYREAHALEVLHAEVNAAAPNRSRASDGWIGDAAHAVRTSDHNPWVTVAGVGVVRARDFTHDPAHGCDADELAEAIRQLGRAGHPALTAGAYVIRNRRIASASHGWTWRPYDGSNPHTKHVHVSVATARAGFDNERRWGVMAKPKPKPNRVTRARQLIAGAAAELEATPRSRVVCHAQAAVLRGVLAVLPRR